MAHGDITHIEIPYDDRVRAVAFYETVFGWDVGEPPGYEGYPMWQAPNQISGGGFVQRTEANGTPLSYIEVDSIDDTLAAVTANGGTIVREKTPISDTSWYAVFLDSEGNQLGIYEAAPDSE